MQYLSKTLRIIYIILIYIIIIAAPFKSSAEVEFYESREYYDIYGLTPADLYRQIKTIGVREGDRFHVALTKAEVSYKADKIMTEDKCYLKNPQVRLDISIRMPKWQNMPKNGKTFEKWKKFYRVILKHEHVHRNYAIDFANEVEVFLKNLGEFKDCNHLDRKVSEHYEELRNELNRKNEKFDETDYKNADMHLTEFLSK